jgi:hypothetical protein
MQENVRTDHGEISCEQLNWTQPAYHSVKWGGFRDNGNYLWDPWQRIFWSSENLPSASWRTRMIKKQRSCIIVIIAPNTWKPLSSCLSTKHTSSLAFLGLAKRWMKAGKWFRQADYRTTREVLNRVFTKQKQDRKETQQNTNSLNSGWPSWCVTVFIRPTFL